jgi:uroporphyrinogen-III synthase
VVSPLIDFASTGELDALNAALRQLEAGNFDWITATSATVVDVLAHHNTVIPPTTKVAVVGESTAAAFTAAGYSVDRMPTSGNNSAEALLEEWPEIHTETHLKVLTLRSNIARPVLTGGLIARGHDVTPVVAFRIIGVPAPARITEDVHSGRINAILISSQTVAEQVLTQFPKLPETTILACVGPQTKNQAEALGLKIQAVAGEQNAESLISAVLNLVDHSPEND